MGVESSSAARSGPSPRAARRGIRVLIVLGVIVILYAITAGVLARPSGQDYLDITSPLPDGTRALAEILRDRGIDVEATEDVDAALASTAPATLLIVYPGRLNAGHLTDLVDAAQAGNDVVLLTPDSRVLDTLGLPVHDEPSADLDVRAQQCDLAEARTAGDAHMGGGYTYAAAGPAGSGVTTCYPVEGAGATLAVVPPLPPGEPTGTAADGAEAAGRFVVLSGAEFMTNRYLDEEGNAALAVGLLNRHSHVSWLTPRVAVPDAVSGGGGLFDLFGPTFWSVVTQLAVGLALLALWRGRRLGPPVPEALPVVVRAAETVEGRGRLYAAAHAREHAAVALRAGAAARLADKLGLPVRIGHGVATGSAGGGPDPAALVASVADHTGRPPMEISALLYGSDMTHPGASTGLSRGQDSSTPPTTPGSDGSITFGPSRAAGYPQGPPSQPVPPVQQGQPVQVGRFGQPVPGVRPLPVAERGARGLAEPDPDDTALLRLALDLDVLDRQVGTR